MRTLSLMIDFTPQHDYLVGIDSDGCAFDTMELKHKECFIPNTINYWGLQGVSKYAREAAEFVNLYSKSRGINRFPALVEALEWTNKRPEVKARGIHVDIPQSLLDWMKRETKLGNPALEKEVQKTGDPRPEAHAGVVQGGQRGDRGDGPRRAAVPVRPREPGKAPATTPTCWWFRPRPTKPCSASGRSTIWRNTRVAICGQEIGTKKESLRAAAKYRGRPHADDRRRSRRLQGGRGQPGAVLPHQSRRGGGQLAAVLRGRDRPFPFRQVRREYQAELLAEFDRYLPDRPPWPVEE